MNNQNNEYSCNGFIAIDEKDDLLHVFTKGKEKDRLFIAEEVKKILPVLAEHHPNEIFFGFNANLQRNPLKITELSIRPASPQLFTKIS
ncbi:hypothetical protein [Calothrix sp. UHCC 0171]|uniref:hypothetical protein n=1 Tax=Calothrix sp. UHCC 0171 TaxID=3110245 RepID=UPI002B1EB65C|nr:hypothetical protein [Calothrix sp. UHCC 0171]MEA5574066.1 hypothetical protein [Calothrix sp. UHCC 0171]